MNVRGMPDLVGVVAVAADDALADGTVITETLTVGIAELPTTTTNADTDDVAEVDTEADIESTSDEAWFNRLDTIAPCASTSTTRKLATRKLKLILIEERMALFSLCCERSDTNATLILYLDHTLHTNTYPPSPAPTRPGTTFP